MRIPYELKRECIEAKKTHTAKYVYENVFNGYTPMNYGSFERCLNRWKKRQMASSELLEESTFGGFIPHNATVQINRDGEIVQVWNKQTEEDFDWDDIISRMNNGIEPIEVGKVKQGNQKLMLEIPLFDMHFGVALFNDYKETLERILHIIGREEMLYDEVNIIIGQDLIHNNDLRGHTAKGTQIDKVDIPKAWEDAYRFFEVIIKACLQNAVNVNISYSKGNHDECISWCFVKALKERFKGAMFDDSLSPRKVISWKNVFVGYGHCQYSNNANSIFQNFVMEFPKEFANAEIREIHSGHLHRESIDNGVMLRRLASGVPSDEWSKENGYVGSHKRFQLFVYEPNRLREIIYV